MSKRSQQRDRERKLSAAEEAMHTTMITTKGGLRMSVDRAYVYGQVIAEIADQIWDRVERSQAPSPMINFEG